MGYTIEISFNILKHGNVSTLKENISSIAVDYNCNNHYYMYDMEGGCNIQRNHCICVVNFDDDELSNCSKFIKVIKRMNDLHLECIYQDNITCKLIYASHYYLTSVDKGKVNTYETYKRERSYSENEMMLLEGLVKPSRSVSL